MPDVEFPGTFTVTVSPTVNCEAVMFPLQSESVAAINGCIIRETVDCFGNHRAWMHARNQLITANDPGGYKRLCALADMLKPQYPR